MDPNANLAEQEAALTRHSAACNEANDRSAREVCICADDIATLRAGLTRWLRKGGFDPDWTKAPNARKYYGR